MPTPSEQKALAFIAIAVLLGGVVRVVRAGAPVEATAAEQQALARQATAAESASAAQVSAKSKKVKKVRQLAPKYRDTVAKVVGGIASVPSYGLSIGAGIPGTGAGDAVTRPGFPPPGPRIDTDARGGAGAGAPNPSPASAGRRGAPPPSAAGPAIDLDQATEAEIDRLPRVGPALARRIIANRDSLGPFGSLAALRRVKGIGPATLERLAPLVTFSGRAAPRAPPD